MADLHFRLLNRDIENTSFDCGNASVNELIKQSYYPTILQHGYCFEVSIQNRIVGYYMLMLIPIDWQDSHGLLDDKYSDMCRQSAVVHIKYLAVEAKYQGKGIGSAILDSIIRRVNEYSKYLPIRLIQLEALKDKYSWYTKRGFVAYNTEAMSDANSTILMYFDCLSQEHQVALMEYIEDY